MEETTKSLWNKTSEELTVSDALKIQGVAIVIGVGATLVTFVGTGVVINLIERRSQRKLEKAIAKENTEKN